MKISIITVTYNSADTLRDTIESILSQTYTDIEYLIIDGKSKDNTLNIVREYEPKFKGKLKWISEPDKGIYDAMNKGIRMATGDVIGILNSDDLYADKNVLHDIANTFTDEVDAVFSKDYMVAWNDTSKIVRKHQCKGYRPFTSGWTPSHPTLYVRREVYEKYGVFDLSFGLSADFELMLRLFEKEKIRNKYLNRFTIKMRMGGATSKNIKNIIEANRSVVRAFKKNGIKITPLYFVRRFYPKFMSLVKCKLFKQSI